MTAGASALLVVIGGGTAGIAAFTGDGPRIVTAVGAGQTAAAPGTAHRPAPPPPAVDAALGNEPDVRADAAPVERRTSDQADRTATRPPRRTGTAAVTTAAPPPAGVGGNAPVGVGGNAPVAPPAPQPPTVTTRTVTETRAIPFRTRLVRDPRLPRGSKEVQAEGVPGEETLRWAVTYSDGRPTDRRLIDSVITREPQHRVVAFGTRRGWRGDGHRHRGCRPGSGHCFPIGRSATCPDKAADRPESTEAGVLDQDFVQLAPQDLKSLEINPGMLC
jgi:hypothetical protein